MSDNERRETHAAIVAKIRAAAHLQNADSPESVLRLADRLEAAHERELAAWKKEQCELLAAIAEERQKPVGNPVALREALSDACYAMFDFLKTQDGPCYREMTEALDKGKAALASPPRNCDRFGGDYKMLHTAWFDWTGSPSGMNPDGTVKMAFGEWLLTLAAKEKEGENDGSK